ncbi:MAG: PAS domain S-box protein [Ignavibacteria bacterium]|nr:PAS domain S-box protein [Ignavibacteria bacterium]MBT8383076.1 PAS domain S-box protein [Ignavibacteria bacterium]MBT8392385.1 PAS domain S-box protein [Ignavibacteria bacterium]NNJ52948.1 PAS domain S-box protein [Ignavibacteriaceae bacterium]NNL22191.1 PAS domain S-box protein [Ignavibacteriaceae bacterium]
MYEILIKSNPEPIFIYDEENLRFLEVNEAAINLYGYTREEFLQMDLTDLYNPEDIQNLLETSEEILKEGEFSKPYRHRRKDGNFIFVQISKIKFKYEENDAVFNTIRDVTETLELEKNNQLYKTVFYNSSDLIFLTDTLGIITFTNDIAASKLGLPGNELLKSSLTSLCEGEDRTLLNNTIFQSQIQEPVTISVQLRTSEGNFLPTNLTATPILDTQSEIEAYSILAKLQVTETGTDEKPREIVKEVIIEKPVKEKSSESPLDSSFLSGVFHEILTPMNVILGFSQELSESIDELTPEQNEAVDIINQNRSSLLGLMNSIIEFSEIHKKKSDLNIEPFAITQLVESLDKNIKEVTGLNDIEFAYGKISSSLKFETDRRIFESTVNSIMRMVSKITDQKKIYFSAYPFDKNVFNINVSDGFARISEPLFNKLTQLFAENKDPKEVGVSRLNFQMISSLLKILDGKFVVYGDSNEQQDCVFSFPMKLNVEVESEVLEKEPEATPEIVEEQPKSEVGFIEEEQKFESEVVEEQHTSEPEIIEEDPVIDDIPEDTFEPTPFVTDELISKKQPEPFIEKEEIEIEEEIVDSGETVDEPKAKVTAKQSAEVNIPEQTKLDEAVPEEEITIDETQPVSENNYLANLSCLCIEDQVDSQILFKVQMKELKNIQFAASFEEAVPLLQSDKFDFIVMDINLQGEYNGLDALKAIHQMQGFENIPIIAVTAYVLPGDREKFIATGFNDFISKPIFREKMYESLKKIFVN